jgi:hypothetical protein
MMIEIITKLNRFETISDYVTLSILDKDSPRKYQDIMLSHYAILSWDKSHHGSWHYMVTHIKAL